MGFDVCQRCALHGSNLMQGVDLLPQRSAQFVTRDKAAATTKALPIRIGRVRTDRNAVGKRGLYSRFHARSITRVTTAGDVAAADNFEEFQIICITFTEVRIQIDRGHVRLGL